MPDSAFSGIGGTRPVELQALLDVAERALYEAVALAVAGSRVGGIGHSLQGFCEAHGCEVARDVAGHGIGDHSIRIWPLRNSERPDEGTSSKHGMCIAIESMATPETWESELLEGDRSAFTAHRSIFVHSEHSVRIPQKEPEILAKFR